GVTCEPVGYVCPSFPKASTYLTKAFTGAWLLFYHSGYCRGPGKAWPWCWADNSAEDDGVHRGAGASRRAKGPSSPTPTAASPSPDR
ncbi:hypothetical protein MTO96_044325, partial [Rhipicephalus appendiculatus]